MDRFTFKNKRRFLYQFFTKHSEVGLTYYLNDDTKLTAGYAYVNHFPADNHKNITQPEHRPWQQIQWHSKYPKLRLDAMVSFGRTISPENFER